MYFKKVAIIYHPVNHFLNIIGFIGIIGHDVGELLVHSVGIICRVESRRILHIIRRKKC